MIKNKKRGIFILLVMLCITFAFVVGCGAIDVPEGVGGGGGNGGGGGGGGNITPTPSGDQLSSVVQSSVTFQETSGSLIVTWDAVPNATSYSLRITKGTSTVGFSATVEEPTVDLHELDGFVLPENGSITIRFTAKASGYTDSAYTTITYELEGTLLLSPEIVSFNNGVIEWKKDAAASSYTVKVDGVAETTQNNTYDVSKLTKSARIDISAKISGKDGAVTSVMYNASAKTLSIMPVTDYTLDGETLKWGEVGGAIGYKIVDLDFNTYTVTTPYYRLAIRNIVYGVYPVMAPGSVVGSAEIAPVDIPYLKGSGTTGDPYVIKTPIDLRAIDYYEIKATEATTSVKYNYKIENDINYNAVSALEGDSNMFTLRKPFMGTLDGGNKTLSNISVHHKNGYWALFDFIANGGTVKNIKFDNVDINNSVQDEEHPTNPAAAMVAYNNYGTVSGITLSNAKFTIAEGGAAGLVVNNYGTVSGCTVNKTNLKEQAVEGFGTAAYEMAGVVLQNYGTVSGNNVTDLQISGATNKTVGSSAGVVAINRKGGTVKDNSFDKVTINNLKSSKEAGGIVAYTDKAGTVTKGTGTLGKLTVNSKDIANEDGASGKGKLYGKKG